MYILPHTCLCLHKQSPWQLLSITIMPFWVARMQVHNLNIIQYNIMIAKCASFWQWWLELSINHYYYNYLYVIKCNELVGSATRTKYPIYNGTCYIDYFYTKTTCTKWPLSNIYCVNSTIRYIIHMHGYHEHTYTYYTYTSTHVYIHTCKGGISYGNHNT